MGALANVPLFAGLSEAKIARLAERFPVRPVADGTVVALRGQPAEHLLVVEKGALTAMYETTQGRTLRLGTFAAPCAIDKTAVLDARGHTATWIADGPTAIRRVPAAELLDLVANVPSARQHVLRHLAGQVRGHQQQLVTTTFGDATARVAAWLVRTAGESGTRVVLPGAQEGLGHAVGVTRVSVNRALSALARDGLVRVEPGVVTILAPELLARRAES